LSSVWNAKARAERGPAALHEPFVPAPDHRLGLAGGPHDLGSAMIIRGQKHNLRSPDVLLRELRLAATASSSLRSAALN
jgi:hypothetical protein